MCEGHWSATRRAAYEQKYGRTVPLSMAERSRLFRQRNPKRYQVIMHNKEQKIRLEVLAHYSPNGVLGCSWSGCTITDPDMLQLDHERNNGAEERKGGGNRSQKIFRKVRREGYPSGYQTLCCNHNWKKELMRRRSGWLQ